METLHRRLLSCSIIYNGENSAVLFLGAKSELKERLLDLVKELKNVKFLRVDEAGDNVALEKLCKQQNVDVKFKFLCPRTPQRNGKVEQTFHTLYGRL
jgi:hypothetical protein